MFSFGDNRDRVITITDSVGGAGFDPVFQVELMPESVERALSPGSPTKQYGKFMDMQTFVMRNNTDKTLRWRVPEPREYSYSGDLDPNGLVYITLRRFFDSYMEEREWPPIIIEREEYVLPYYISSIPSSDFSTPGPTGLNLTITEDASGDLNFRLHEK